MSLGGYVMYFNVSELMGTKSNISGEEYEIILKENKTQFAAQRAAALSKLNSRFKDFYSSRANTLVIDFITSNYELGYFNSIILQVSSDSTGLDYSVDINSFNIDKYYYNYDSGRTVMEAVFLILTILLMAHRLFYDVQYAIKIAILRSHNREIILEFKKKFNLINDNEKSKLSVFFKQTDPIEPSELLINKKKKSPIVRNKTFVDKVKVQEEPDKPKRKFLFKDFIYAFFNFYSSNLLETLYIISLIISIIQILMWLSFTAKIKKDGDFLTKTFDSYNVILSFEFSDAIHSLSRELNNYIKVLAWNAFVVLWRLMKIFEDVFPLLKKYITGFRKALSDILSFFILFFLIVFGISLILYFFYSYNNPSFNSLTSAFINNLLFFIGTIDFSIVNNMYYASNRIFTIIYFTALIFFIRFAFLKILLGIILYHFFNIKFSSGNRYKKCTVSEFKKKTSRNFLYQIYNLIISLPNAIYKLITCQICCNKVIKKNPPKKNSIKEISETQINNVNDNNNNNNDNKNIVINNDQMLNKKEDNFDESSKLNNKPVGDSERRIDFGVEKINDKDVNEKNSDSVDNKDIKIDIFEKPRGLLGLKGQISNIESVNNLNTNNKNILTNNENNFVNYNSNSANSTTLSKKVLELEDLRFIYSKFIENFEIISRDPYFDSSKDIEKINIYYQKKYESNFKQNLIYIILVLFLILSILYNTLSPLRYYVNKLVLNKYSVKGVDQFPSFRKFLLFMFNHFCLMFV